MDGDDHSKDLDEKNTGTLSKAKEDGTDGLIVESSVDPSPHPSLDGAGSGDSDRESLEERPLSCGDGGDGEEEGASLQSGDDGLDNDDARLTPDVQGTDTAHDLVTRTGLDLQAGPQSLSEQEVPEGPGTSQHPARALDSVEEASMRQSEIQDDPSSTQEQALDDAQLEIQDEQSSMQEQTLDDVHREMRDDQSSMQKQTLDDAQMEIQDDQYRSSMIEQTLDGALNTNNSNAAIDTSSFDNVTESRRPGLGPGTTEITPFPQRDGTDHDSINTGHSDLSSREASIVAQDLVQNVLDKVLRAETGEGMVGLHQLISGGAERRKFFPELEKVDLSSEDGESESGVLPTVLPAEHDAFHRGNAEELEESDVETVGSLTPTQTDAERNSQLRESADSDRNDPQRTIADKDRNEPRKEGAGSELQDTGWEEELPAESQSLAALSENQSGEAPPKTQGKAAKNRSPNQQYPINVNNYKVCRMLSPNMKECLILETGEQVLIDCSAASRRGHVCDGRECDAAFGSDASSPERDRVKKNLFSDKRRVEGGEDSGEQDGSPHRPRATRSDTEDTPVAISEAAFDPSLQQLASKPHQTAAGARPSQDTFTEHHPQRTEGPGSTQVTDSRPSQVTDPKYMQVADPRSMQVTDPKSMQVSDPESRYFPDPRSTQVSDSRSTQVTDSRNTQVTDSRSTQVSYSRSTEFSDPESTYVPDRRSIPVSDHRSTRVTDPRSPQARFTEKHSQRTEGPDPHDGSYLWLQQQLQWRAASNALPSHQTVVPRTSQSSRVSRTGVIPKGRHAQQTGESSAENSCVWNESSTLSAHSTVSAPSPGVIPNFKTLQDQQVSWLSMYHELEQRHRGAQHSLEQQQAALHRQDQQHRIGREQRAGDSETSRQQTLGDMGRSWRRDEREEERHLADCPSLRQSSSRTRASSRSPRQETVGLRGSEHRPYTSELDARGQDRCLRGGVYSSPLPIYKAKTSPRELHGGSVTQDRLGEDSLTRSSSHSRQPPPTLDPLSPRSESTLRERHAKHLSDLRSYYEAEIQDLRHQLSALSGRLEPSASRSPVGVDRNLQQDNQALRSQIRDLHDSLDDANIYIRELEQKLQGLEIRASDYSKRYEESQQNVLKLKNRLEELHAYTKDREGVLEQAQASDVSSTLALQQLRKAHEEQAQAARRDKAALNKLLDKYDRLEKEYELLKENSTQFEQKLFESRTEAVELNKKVCDLELENKRLTHDNHNLRHTRAMASSYSGTRQPVSHRVRDEDPLSDDGDNFQRSASSHHGPRTPPSAELEDARGVTLSNGDSPLLRAERELRRLQHSVGDPRFKPAVQVKQYATLHSPTHVPIIDSLASKKRQQPPPVRSGEGGRRGKGGGGSAASSVRQKTGVSAPSSPPKAAVAASNAASPQRSAGGVKDGSRGQGSDVPQSSPAASPLSNNHDGVDGSRHVDATLEHIRSGHIVSRPQWEDVYTSLAKTQANNNVASLSMTQEEMLRERIKSIGDMEHRYDHLQMEKRKLESQLNKVPSHPKDRQSRRDKERLEDMLDNVDHELGSLRMTLKRYQVLKTTM